MFPEKLARDHILFWSNTGDLVFDPMCGAGTTCKMAKATGRRWLGVDICREYTSIARRCLKEIDEDFMTPSPHEKIHSMNHWVRTFKRQPMQLSHANGVRTKYPQRGCS